MLRQGRTLFAHYATSLTKKLITAPRWMFMAQAYVNKALMPLLLTFRKRAATGLLSGRSFVLPVAQDQVNNQTDFELITWLVVR